MDVATSCRGVRPVRALPVLGRPLGRAPSVRLAGPGAGGATRPSGAQAAVPTSLQGRSHRASFVRSVALNGHMPALLGGSTSGARRFALSPLAQQRGQSFFHTAGDEAGRGVGGSTPRAGSNGAAGVPGPEDAEVSTDFDAPEPSQYPDASPENAGETDTEDPSDEQDDLIALIDEEILSRERIMAYGSGSDAPLSELDDGQADRRLARRRARQDKIEARLRSFKPGRIAHLERRVWEQRAARDKAGGDTGSRWMSPEERELDEAKNKRWLAYRKPRPKHRPGLLNKQRMLERADELLEAYARGSDEDPGSGEDAWSDGGWTDEEEQLRQAVFDDEGVALPPPDPETMRLANEILDRSIIGQWWTPGRSHVLKERHYRRMPRLLPLFEQRDQDEAAEEANAEKIRKMLHEKHEEEERTAKIEEEMERDAEEKKRRQLVDGRLPLGIPHKWDHRPRQNGPEPDVDMLDWISDENDASSESDFDQDSTDDEEEVKEKKAEERRVKAEAVTLNDVPLTKDPWAPLQGVSPGPKQFFTRNKIPESDSDEEFEERLQRDYDDSADVDVKLDLIESIGAHLVGIPTMAEKDDEGDTITLRVPARQAARVAGSFRRLYPENAMRVLANQGREIAKESRLIKKEVSRLARRVKRERARAHRGEGTQAGERTSEAGGDDRRSEASGDERDGVPAASHAAAPSDALAAEPPQATTWRGYNPPPEPPLKGVVLGLLRRGNALVSKAALSHLMFMSIYPVETEEIMKTFRDPKLAQEPIIRFKLKAHYPQLLTDAVHRIMVASHFTGAHISGPVFLPTKRKLYTILRSPHVNKTSREQFESRLHTRLLDVHVPTPATWAALARMQLQGAINTHMFFQHQIDALRQRGMEARARALRRREGTYTAEDYLADEGARRRHAESGQDLPLIDKKTTESLDKLFSPAMAQKRFEKLMASPHQERDPSYWGPFLKSLKNGQQRAVVERVLGLRKNDEGRSHPEDLRRAREQEALRLLRIIEASMRPEVIGNSAPGGPSGVPEGGVDVPDEEGMERMRDHLRVAALETAFGKNPLWSTEGDDATVGVEAGGDKAEEAAPGDETDEAALGGEAGQAAPGDEVRSIEHDASGSSDAGKD